ncbi:MAG TPA: hypothetical protein DCL35_04830 [Candidatus Omnitrophica bacterium]|nr:hypothetical protein [Candidatus Omnitrophota bacterium]
MGEIAKAREPFQFFTRLHLSELTGLKAGTLEELLEQIRTVSGSCIYHHTHRFLQQHQYLSPEPPNDFAFWVAETLGERELAERLASIDTVQFSSIRALREKIISTIEDYMKEYPLSKMRFASEGRHFYFIKSISFVLPTPYVAHDLREFLDILNKVTFDSIYFHIFESRLRLEKGDNDFSYWINNSIGDPILAQKISKLDPYTRTMDDLKRTIISIVEKRMAQNG